MKPRPRSLVGRPSVDAVDPVRLEALAYDVELGRAKPQVVSVKPRVGLQLSASPRAPFLLGGNRGEFGGELVLSDGVVAQTLLHENVVSIVRLRSDIIVVTGLAHLSESGGALYRVTHDASGRYVASLWKILPGAPLDVAMTTAGDLLVPCTELDVLVSVEGDFRQN